MKPHTAAPWLDAAEKLSLFTIKRCVQLTVDDWRQLSEVMQQISKLCASASQEANEVPLVYALELLLRLGEVTSSLLSLNGDEPTFSVARVAQAIRTTTLVLETVEQSADGAGLPHEVADALARQRCEQTHLLSAMAWALRQEARALFFNPRPTALSLATALLDLFRVITRTWPDELFIPLLSAAAHDPSAGRLADPAAQLAGALLRCAGRAMTDIGVSSSKQLMVPGLTVGYELMQQISSLMFDLGLDLMPADQPHVKQLMQSPSVLHLMMTMLAVLTQRLHQHLGIQQIDSFTVKHAIKQQYEAALLNDINTADRRIGGAYHKAAVPNDINTVDRRHGGADEQQQQQQRFLHRNSSKRQRTLEEEEDEDDDHAGPGDLHQLWTQVLAMGKKAAAAANSDTQQQQQQQHNNIPPSPLIRLWSSLGLPHEMLPLAAAAAEVFTGAVEADYRTACKVARFLLLGSSHLQPPKEPQEPKSPTAALAGAGSGEGSPMFQHSLSLTRSLSATDADMRATAASPTAATAALLVDSCRDYGLRGLEELEVLQLQRSVPLVLLDTAATLSTMDCSAALSTAKQPASAGLQQQQKQQQEQLAGSSLTAATSGLELVNVSCCAAAAAARCWPVLERVTAVQWASWSGLVDSAPSGVFPRLKSLYWQQYESASEEQIPVQELLQLVCCLIQHLLDDDHQDQNYHDPHQQHDVMLSGSVHRVAVAVGSDVSAGTRDMHKAGANGKSKSVPVISPRAREALVALIEVLTSVSKLPYAQGNISSSDKYTYRHQLSHCQQVLSAWNHMCQPVVAAVEHVLRRAGAAAVSNAAAVAAAATAAAKKQRFATAEDSVLSSGLSNRAEFSTAYPTVVALGSCLAVMLSPLGRPGPLLVAAGSEATVLGQQHAPMQLFALLVSEIKVLLSETSVKRELLAMHALEQAPLYMLKKIRQQQQAAVGAALDNSSVADQQAAAAAAVDQCHQQQRTQHDEALAAAVPWLLLLARLLMLRGQLLSDVLQRDLSAHQTDEQSRFSTLHNSFWHIQMAEASASMLETYLEQINCRALNTSAAAAMVHSNTAAAGIHSVLDPCKWNHLVLALRQAGQLCKAALKLARHYHETGFASGFAAGFTAGYAAAVAAGATATISSAADASHPSFTSPIGVLHQQQIWGLPQQLKSLGAQLSDRLAMQEICSNPECVNLQESSELLLMAGATPTACLSCGLLYCSDECKAAHKAVHRKACKRRSQSGSLCLSAVSETDDMMENWGLS